MPAMLSEDVRTESQSLTCQFFILFLFIFDSCNGAFHGSGYTVSNVMIMKITLKVMKY
jgi:hypothetical protein